MLFLYFHCTTQFYKHYYKYYNADFFTSTTKINWCDNHIVETRVLEKQKLES